MDNSDTNATPAMRATTRAWAPNVPGDRVRRVSASTRQPDEILGITERLIPLAKSGLSSMYRADARMFVQTTKASSEGLVPVGTSLRYTAMCALGLSLIDADEQREILSGTTAADLSISTVKAARNSVDLGGAALALWAAAEAAGEVDDNVLARVSQQIQGDAPVSTVEASWCLTALIASRVDPSSAAVQSAVRRLRGAQGSTGIFPHVLPPDSQHRFRRHVGCFADQVYPIQALARHHVVTGEGSSLHQASLCGDRISDLQGPDGQWWWHYDTRTGEIVEGYPVYSVHQHAMGPMALLELEEAGGSDRRSDIASGLTWVQNHPESTDELIEERQGIVWRSVKRREPLRLSRRANAAASSIHPQARISGLQRWLPPLRVDRECRPYELGWLLYAWLGGPVSRI